MKVIISHDVDHLTAFEHLNDLILPKIFIKSAIEWKKGYISKHEIFYRIRELFTNKLENLNAMMDFDLERNIPATFFIGMNQGKGLSYSIESAQEWAKVIKKRGFDVGVHGISFSNHKGILKEYKRFRNCIGEYKFGIRMHYLRIAPETLNNLEKAGYLFDTTIHLWKDCYKVGRMWEFPLHIMDGDIWYPSRKYQNLSFKEMKICTVEKIRELKENNFKYISILFHDRYFNNSYQAFKDWYIWLIEYLLDNNCKFIDYRKAIQELES